MQKILGRAAWALPLLLGVVGFFAVVGPRALYPTNIAWLRDGDPATHFLGWVFFRNTDWTFPLGLNPRYGLEISSAVIYSDSNPLFAVLFKALSPVLPEPFQYFGLWLLLCFVLQAWFAWKLVGLLSDSPAIRALGTGFFIFSPPMIWRLYGHFSLVGHFLIVAALYLVLCPQLRRRWLKWGLLLAVAASVNGYLLAMVAALWLTDLAGRTTSGRQTAGLSLGELAALATTSAFVCWQAGYFSIEGGVGGAGYGYYRMNLLAILDPDNWSYLLKDLPAAEGDYEGFNYLGLGGLVLLLFAVPSLASGRARVIAGAGKRPFLILALVGLTLFSVSNKIGFGTQQFELPLPDVLLEAASVFRSSGRMFWVVFYALLFAMICVILRGHGTRAAVGILSVALFVQVADTHSGWAGIRKRLMVKASSEWPSALQDPFWNEAASRYAKVRWLLAANPSRHWLELSTYAANHGLSTDAVFLARIDASKLDRARLRGLEALNSGRYEPDTLYLLEDRLLLKAAMTLDPQRDLLAKLDGLNVLAPGWKTCARCPSVETEARLEDLLAMLGPLERGQTISFDSSSKGAGYLLDGWSWQEPWGIWSDGPVADMILPLSFDDPQRLLVEAHAFVKPSHPEQDVEVWVNGVLEASTRLSISAENRIEVSLSDAARRKIRKPGFLHLRFRFADAASPQDIGENSDNRRLAIGLLSVTAY